MSTIKFLSIILAIDAFCISLALLLGDTPDRHFNEISFITLLSAIQLVACSILSWKIFKLRSLSSSKDPASKNSGLYIVWKVISLGFIYLALDEVAQIHEGLDKLIHYLFHIKETRITDRIDDVIVGIYVIIGLIILVIFKREIKIYPRINYYLIPIFILLFGMVALDTITERHDVVRFFIEGKYFINLAFHWLRALEEICKIIAGGILASMFYYVYKSNRDLLSYRG